jgi:hypothetical protein
VKAAAPVVDETPNVHGFFDVSVKNAYITPRGLVVENQEFVFQAIGALIVPVTDQFTIIGGAWTDWNTHQHDPDVGAFNEIDPFIVFDYAPSKTWDFSLTYVPFISPTGAFRTEENLELKVGYKDAGAGGWTFNPYGKFFYSAGGDSTVVLGKGGDTFDVELGLIPTYVWKATETLPVTLTFPTFFTVGPSEFWGGENNFGVFSTAVSAQIPLNFIPHRYGFWHANASLTYLYLLNGQLADAAALLGGGDERNRFVGSVGIGFNF